MGWAARDTVHLHASQPITMPLLLLLIIFAMLYGVCTYDTLNVSPLLNPKCTLYSSLPHNHWLSPDPVRRNRSTCAVTPSCLPVIPNT